MHWLVATPAYVAHHYFATADELPPALQDHMLGPAAMQGKIRAVQLECMQHISIELENTYA